LITFRGTKPALFQGFFAVFWLICPWFVPVFLLATGTNLRQTCDKSARNQPQNSHQAAEQLLALNLEEMVPDGVKKL
jgi:hypothetical protein